MRLAARYAARSDIGLNRQTNEDAWLVRPPLFAVADGMGGARAGEVASRVALQTLAAAVETIDPRDRSAAGEALEAAAHGANRRVWELSTEYPSQAGMGTTLTALALCTDGARLAHIGDSRAYLLRDGTLTQITADHSLVAEMVRSGELPAEQAGGHPLRSVLSRALGTEPEPVIDILDVDLLPGDVLLLCSDGLSGPVPAERIAECLAVEDPERAAGELVEAALEAGGPDNITAVVLRLDEAPPATGGTATVAAGAAAVPATVAAGALVAPPPDETAPSATPHDTPSPDETAPSATPIAALDEPKSTATPHDTPPEDAESTATPDDTPPRAELEAPPDDTSPSAAAEKAAPPAGGEESPAPAPGEASLPAPPPPPVAPAASSRAATVSRGSAAPSAVPASAASRAARRRRWLLRLAVVLLILVVIAAGVLVLGELEWVGVDEDGFVTVYRGLPWEFAGLRLYRVDERALALRYDDLSSAERRAVDAHAVGWRGSGERLVERLREAQ